MNNLKSILHDLDLLQTNAVEGLEQNQNTIDSQNAINNLREYLTQAQPTSKELKQELIEVANDNLISMGELSKQEFAKELLKKYFAPLKDVE